MKDKINIEKHQIVCNECFGVGKKHHKLRQKVLINHQTACQEFEKLNKEGIAPVRPKGHPYICKNCNGLGLVDSPTRPIADIENYPTIAIIGGGIGGVALALACLHRKIPFTIYERDSKFDARAQGYGLTLQQATKVIKELGISTLHDGLVSTRHVVHTTEGKVIGEWGMRKWVHDASKTSPRNTNIHIARQSLRLALINQLGGHEFIQWNHQLVDLKQTENEGVDLVFKTEGELKTAKANIVVGADGIRSSVRKLILRDNINPLQYLGCMVILGICQLDTINAENDLLDSATVFQTANGSERIYMMPYDKKSVMWQLSFPVSETEAKLLSEKGAKALKEEACRRTQWHSPIPEILLATLEAQISGYPVYDREPLKLELSEKFGNITLIGDAAHPMSPFKGQGANQALLDALALARNISKNGKTLNNWKEVGARQSILTQFETEMLKRIESKVKDSATAAHFLHTENILKEGNEPRGRFLKGSE